jgi:hypothetical protein
MNVNIDAMELMAGKGRVSFISKNDDGSTNQFSHFGTLKGEAKWAKVLEPDQYDNYAVDIYGDFSHVQEEAEAIAAKAAELVEAAGKKVQGIADVVKENNEGVEYVQFKRKGSKADGSPNTPPKIYNASGAHIEGWDKLIGNGSKVGVAYYLAPYYMASTKMVGVSLKFYALQVIDLVAYSGGGGGSSPFGNESGEDVPFDTEEEAEY